jgi:PAS domain S-box-containing protein
MTASKRYGMRSLRFRLALASVLVEAVMLTVLVWNSTRITGDAMQEIFQNRVQTLVPLMNVGLANPLAQRDYATLDERLGHIVNQESLTYIEVRDELGNLAATRGEVPATMELDSSFETADGVFDQAFDITVVNRVIGRARYGLDVRLLATTLASLQAQSMILALIEMGLTFLLLATLGYLLTRHLQSLAQAARALEGGDYAVRAADDGRDEVGDTAHAFNSMAATIEQDIAERNQAEQALRDAKAFSENLIQTANVMVVGLDTSGCVSLMNRTSEKITGYTQAEMKGKNWFEILVPKEKYPEVWEEFNRLTAGGVPKTFENPILTKSGEERHIVWQNNEIRMGEKIVGTISFGNDITERKQAEEQLRDSESKLRKILDGLGPSVYVGLLTPEGILLYANQPALRAANLKPDVLAKAVDQSGAASTASCTIASARIFRRSTWALTLSAPSFQRARSVPSAPVWIPRRNCWNPPQRRFAT